MIVKGKKVTIEAKLKRKKLVYGAGKNYLKKN